MTTDTSSTFLDYAQRGKHAIWRYILAILLALIIQVGVSVAAIVPLIVAHVLPSDLKAAVGSSHPSMFFMIMGISFGALVLGLALAVAVLHAKQPIDLLGRWRWGAFAAGLALWFGFCLICAGF